jgi:hypothetical protein
MRTRAGGQSSSSPASSSSCSCAVYHSQACGSLACPRAAADLSTLQVSRLPVGEVLESLTPSGQPGPGELGVPTCCRPEVGQAFWVSGLRGVGETRELAPRRPEVGQLFSAKSDCSKLPRFLASMGDTKIFLTAQSLAAKAKVAPKPKGRTSKAKAKADTHSCSIVGCVSSPTRCFGHRRPSKARLHPHPCPFASVHFPDGCTGGRVCVVCPGTSASSVPCGCGTQLCLA